MTKPSTPAIWAGGKVFGFQPSAAQQAQGFDYIATVRPTTGAPITDDHDWPLNNITTSLKWVMDQLPDGGVQALLTALLPKRSFAGSDFIRIPDTPGGWIFQWGVATFSTSDSVNGTSNSFVTPFPNACLAVLASDFGTTSAACASFAAGGYTQSSFKCWARNPASSGAFVAASGRYFAVGY